MPLFGPPNIEKLTAAASRLAAGDGRLFEEAAVKAIRGGLADRNVAAAAADASRTAQAAVKGDLTFVEGGIKVIGAVAPHALAAAAAGIAGAAAEAAAAAGETLEKEASRAYAAAHKAIAKKAIEGHAGALSIEASTKGRAYQDAAAAAKTEIAKGRQYDLRERRREAERILAAEADAAARMAELATWVAEAAASTLVTASDRILGAKIPRRVGAACFATVVAEIAKAVAATGPPVVALAATAALSAAAKAVAAESGFGYTGAEFPR